MCFLVLLMLVKNTFLLCSTLNANENQYVFSGVINAYENHLFAL
jgi:hypothetical protein